MTKPALYLSLVIFGGAYRAPSKMEGGDTSMVRLKRNQLRSTEVFLL